MGLSTSGLAATCALAANIATHEQMLAYLGLGTLGSLLPDLDADNSMPVQISFTLASIILAFAVMFLLTDTFPSIAEMLAVWFATYLSFRWLVFALFTRLTTHRGIFHSIPAAVFFGMLTAIAAEHVFAQPALQSWLSGSFVAFGYLVHLILDEIYSVNLFGMRTRRSLGSALKLWSPGSHAASVYLYAACIAAALLTPAQDTFFRVISSPQLYTDIRDRLVPTDGWFRPELRTLSR